MRARIDEAGVLLGTAEDGNGPQVPVGFDLQAGRYRWHAGLGQWWPLGRAEVTSDEAPDATAAIVAGFRALAAGGATLPPQTVAWMDWYERTFDARIKQTRKRA